MIVDERTAHEILADVAQELDKAERNESILIDTITNDLCDAEASLKELDKGPERERLTQVYNSLQARVSVLKAAIPTVIAPVVPHRKAWVPVAIAVLVIFAVAGLIYALLSYVN